MSTQPSTRFAIHSTDELQDHITKGHSLENHVVHDADLTSVDGLAGVNVDGAVIVGCELTAALRHDLAARGAAVLPGFDHLPYSPYLRDLYTSDELLSGYDTGGYTGTLDFKIYTHFDRARRRFGNLPPIHESLAQRLHDHAIDDALYRFVQKHGGDRIVGIMGGHSTGRDHDDFARVVRLCRELTQRGYVVATGGGPGIMEAGNLGAYLAGYDDDDVVDAVLDMLAEAPKFANPELEGQPEYLEQIRAYMAAGYNARRATQTTEFKARYGARKDPTTSLAVPTWFYGHEPSNLFCDHVAKYFSNGLREDVLLAVSRAGVVFAPGSAGTIQEIFMDLAQNHYATFVDRSVMAFLGNDEFQRRSFELVRDFAGSKQPAEAPYQDMIGIFDDPTKVVDFIASTPPRERARKPPLYDLA